MIRGEKSQWLNVYSGVPQGSVIGPILFLIYINDLPNGIKSKINIFADDTKMASKVDTVEDEKTVNEDLEALQNWSVTNNMKFNVNKCSVMHCGRLNRNIDYKLYGQKLRVTESEKDLGVIVNSDMKFKDQVASAAKKANKTLGMIKRNFEYVNKDAFEVLYGTLVRPQLEYAVHLWSPYQIGLREKLEQLQRRATKLVRNIKYKSYDERLCTLNLMSTLDRRERGDMIMTYNILNDRVEMDARFMKINTESRTRGHTMNLKINRSKIEIRRNFFSNRIKKTWNGLSQETINSKTIDAFKRAYDQEKRLNRRCSTTSS